MRKIVLIILGVLMAAYSAKDIARALENSGGKPPSERTDPKETATDPASKEQRELYEKEQARARLAKQVLELPPLTPEQIEQFKAEDAWNAGLRQAPALQKRPPAGPAQRRNPWDN